jgi:hypothetical protein
MLAFEMLATLLAHCRPQPAIPALLLLMLTLLVALPAANQTEPSTLVVWIVPLGLLGSAGLALAAGFCSFFPPVAWLAMAWLASSLLRSIAAPLIEPALWAGAAIAVLGLGIQAWRVATRRFMPTLPARDGG